MRHFFAAILAALLAWLPGASAQQRVTSDIIRGEWLAKIDGIAAAGDAGERGFRVFAALGTDGVGRARYVVNGKSGIEFMNITAENDAVTFTAPDRARADLKLTASGELAGTWTLPGKPALKVTLRKAPPARQFDKTYSGRADSPGTNQCVSLDMKITVKDGHVTGNMGYTYLSYSLNYDIVGEAWGNGDVDYSLFTAGPRFAGYLRGRLENGRFKTQYPSNCGIFEFDLR